jgi:hypothetical protein
MMKNAELVGAFGSRMVCTRSGSRAAASWN